MWGGSEPLTALQCCACGHRLGEELSHCLILLLPSPTPPMLLPPEGPSTSLFPGCISQEASSGHEPFPPNTDCICCLSTMIELLIQSQLAAMKRHAPSIYPMSFYYHLKYSGTALHPERLQNHLAAQPQITIPVELS